MLCVVVCHSHKTPISYSLFVVPSCLCSIVDIDFDGDGDGWLILKVESL